MRVMKAKAKKKSMTKHTNPPSMVRHGSTAVIGPSILALGNLYCFCCVQTNLHRSTGLSSSIALGPRVILWSTGNCSRLLDTSAFGTDICIQCQSPLLSAAAPA